ncbi:MAG: hypothetical protein IT168_32935 [Bryobacterales bacterium]|nr:hypothetical protein [Bryobacterales bacterium]
MRAYLLQVCTAYLFLFGAVASPQDGLRVVIKTGDGAFNDVSRGEVGAVVVTVVDASDKPVEGATVTFTLPFSGPGAAFAGGGREFTATSDHAGIAKMAAAKPNKEEGRFNIKVKAVAPGGRTGTAVVAQSNTAAMARKGTSGKKVLILALVGGGASAALIAAKRGGGSSSTAGGPSVPGTTSLSAGVLTVGAPR